jgi:hypothetical protein
MSSCLLSRNVKIKIYKIIILPVVFYGRETWSLKLREEHRLRVFVSRMLGGIFVPKRDEVTGGWIKLHNEELHNLYCSPNWDDQIKEDEMGGTCSAYGEMRNVYRILIGKPEGRRPLGVPRHRWAESIKMSLRKTGFEGVDWIHMSQDRDLWRAFVNTVMNLLVPGSIKGGEFLD